MAQDGMVLGSASYKVSLDTKALTKGLTKTQQNLKRFTGSTKSNLTSFDRTLKATRSGVRSFNAETTRTVKALKGLHKDFSTLSDDQTRFRAEVRQSTRGLETLENRAEKAARAYRRLGKEMRAVRGRGGGGAGGIGGFGGGGGLDGGAEIAALTGSALVARELAKGDEKQRKLRTPRPLRPVQRVTRRYFKQFPNEPFNLGEIPKVRDMLEDTDKGFKRAAKSVKFFGMRMDGLARREMRLMGQHAANLRIRMQNLGTSFHNAGVKLHNYGDKMRRTGARFRGLSIAIGGVALAMTQMDALFRDLRAEEQYEAQIRRIGGSVDALTGTLTASTKGLVSELELQRHTARLFAQGVAQDQEEAVALITAAQAFEAKGLGTFEQNIDRLADTISGGALSPMEDLIGGIGDLKDEAIAMGIATEASVRTWNREDEVIAARAVLMQHLTGVNEEFTNSQLTSRQGAQKGIAAWQNTTKWLKEMLANGVSPLLTAFGNMPPSMQKAAVGAGVLAAAMSPALEISGNLIQTLSGLPQALGAVGGAMKVLAGITKISTVITWAITAAQWAWNIAVYASPIGWIAIAIIAVVAVIALLFWRSKKFRDFFLKMWEKIKQAVQVAWDFITKTIGKHWKKILMILFPVIGIGVLLARHWGKFVDFFKKIFDKIRQFVPSIVYKLFGMEKPEPIDLSQAREEIDKTVEATNAAEEEAKKKGSWWSRLFSGDDNKGAATPAVPVKPEWEGGEKKSTGGLWTKLFGRWNTLGNSPPSLPFKAKWLDSPEMTGRNLYGDVVPATESVWFKVTDTIETRWGDILQMLFPAYGGLGARMRTEWSDLFSGGSVNAPTIPTATDVEWEWNLGGTFKTVYDTWKGAADFILSPFRKATEWLWHLGGRFFVVANRWLTNQAKQILDGAKKAIEWTWNMVGTVFTVVTDAIMAFAGHVLDGAKAALNWVWNMAGTIFSKVTGAIMTFASAVIDGAKAAIGWIWNITGTAISFITDKIIEFVGAVVDGAKAAINWIWNLAGDFASKVAEWLAGAAKSIIDGATAVVEWVWNLIGNFASTVADWLADGAAKILAGVASVVEWTWNLIGNFATTVASWLADGAAYILAGAKTAIVWAWNLGGDFATTVASLIAGAVKTLLDGAKTAIEWTWNLAGDFASTAATLLAGAAKSILDGAKKVIQWGWNLTGTFFVVANRWLTNQAKQILDGAKTAISWAWNLAGNFITNASSVIMAFAKSLIDAGSATFNWAWNLAGNFITKVTSTITDFAKSVIDGAASAITWTWDLAGDFLTTGQKWLTDVGNVILNAAKDTINWVLNVSGTIAKAITDFLAAGAGVWSNLVSGTKALILNVSGSIVEAVSTFITSGIATWNAIVAGTKNLILNLSGTISDAVDGVISKWNGVVSDTKNLILNLSGTIADSVEKFLDKGAKIWSGLVSGTKSLVMNLTGTVVAPVASFIRNAGAVWSLLKSETKDFVFNLGGTISTSVADFVNANKDWIGAIGDVTAKWALNIAASFTGFAPVVGLAAGTKTLWDAIVGGLPVDLELKAKITGFFDEFDPPDPNDPTDKGSWQYHLWQRFKTGWDNTLKTFTAPFSLIFDIVGGNDQQQLTYSFVVNDATLETVATNTREAADWLQNIFVALTTDTLDSGGVTLLRMPLTAVGDKATLTAANIANNAQALREYMGGGGNLDANAITGGTTLAGIKTTLENEGKGTRGWLLLMYSALRYGETRQMLQNAYLIANTLDRDGLKFHPASLRTNSGWNAGNTTVWYGNMSWDVTGNFLSTAADKITHISHYSLKRLSEQLEWLGVIASILTQGNAADNKAFINAWAGYFSTTPLYNYDIVPDIEAAWDTKYNRGGGGGSLDASELTGADSRTLTDLYNQLRLLVGISISTDRDALQTYLVNTRNIDKLYSGTGLSTKLHASLYAQMDANYNRAGGGAVTLSADGSDLAVQVTITTKVKELWTAFKAKWDAAARQLAATIDISIGNTWTLFKTKWGTTSRELPVTLGIPNGADAWTAFEKEWGTGRVVLVSAEITPPKVKRAAVPPGTPTTIDATAITGGKTLKDIDDTVGRIVHALVWLPIIAGVLTEKTFAGVQRFMQTLRGNRYSPMGGYNEQRLRTSVNNAFILGAYSRAGGGGGDGAWTEADITKHLNILEDIRQWLSLIWVSGRKDAVFSPSSKAAAAETIPNTALGTTGSDWTSNYGRITSWGTPRAGGGSVSVSADGADLTVNLKLSQTGVQAWDTFKAAWGTARAVTVSVTTTTGAVVWRTFKAAFAAAKETLSVNIAIPVDSASNTKAWTDFKAAWGTDKTVPVTAQVTADTSVDITANVTPAATAWTTFKTAWGTTRAVPADVSVTDGATAWTGFNTKWGTTRSVSAGVSVTDGATAWTGFNTKWGTSRSVPANIVVTAADTVFTTFNTAWGTGREVAANVKGTITSWTSSIADLDVTGKISKFTQETWMTGSDWAATAWKWLTGTEDAEIEVDSDINQFGYEKSWMEGSGWRAKVWGWITGSSNNANYNILGSIDTFSESISTGSSVWKKKIWTVITGSTDALRTANFSIKGAVNAITSSLTGTGWRKTIWDLITGSSTTNPEFGIKGRVNNVLSGTFTGWAAEVWRGVTGWSGSKPDFDIKGTVNSITNSSFSGWVAEVWRGITGGSGSKPDFNIKGLVNQITKSSFSGWQSTIWNAITGSSSSSSFNITGTVNRILGGVSSTGWVREIWRGITGAYGAKPEFDVEGEVTSIDGSSTANSAAGATTPTSLLGKIWKGIKSGYKVPVSVVGVVSGILGNLSGGTVKIDATAAVFTDIRKWLRSIFAALTGDDLTAGSRSVGVYGGISGVSNSDMKKGQALREYMGGGSNLKASDITGGSLYTLKSLYNRIGITNTRLTGIDGEVEDVESDVERVKTATDAVATAVRGIKISGAAGGFSEARGEDLATDAYRATFWLREVVSTLAFQLLSGVTRTQAINRLTYAKTYIDNLRDDYDESSKATGVTGIAGKAPPIAPPATGASGVGGAQGEKCPTININIAGSIYGVDDLQAQIMKAVREGMRLKSLPL